MRSAFESRPVSSRRKCGCARHVIALLIPLLFISGATAQTYWTLFNSEVDGTDYATYVTYSTRDDMLNDSNRTGIYFPFYGGDGQRAVGSGSDGKKWWTLFNTEGESFSGAFFATYNSLEDMLEDTNRVGIFGPAGGGEAANVVGTGSNGVSYWNIFNIEGESSSNARYVYYANLGDMLLDINRTGVFTPSGGAAGDNVVGSGSDGLNNYWSIFNIEGESVIKAAYVTYATNVDMVNDTNRTGTWIPDTTAGPQAVNVIGSGAMVPPPCNGCGCP